LFEMLQTATANQASMMRADRDTHSHSEGVVVRSLVIGLTAFLTVVDLFATQAILPSLARHYDVTAAAMGFAVNASTMGMAVAGLAVGFFSQRIDRRLGILGQPGSIVLADRAARISAKPDSFHRIAYLPGPLHGVGIHAHPCVSG
jgi:MFS transporter, YNFM family, putative membrane transport protein